MYAKYKEEEDVEPDDPSKTKVSTPDNISRRKSLDDDTKHEADLDVPGSELDDQQEDVFLSSTFNVDIICLTRSH